MCPEAMFLGVVPVAPNGARGASLINYNSEELISRAAANTFERKRTQACVAAVDRYDATVASSKNRFWAKPHITQKNRVKSIFELVPKIEIVRVCVADGRHGTESQK